MELFDPKYVLFMWDESLKGKSGFVANDIETLKKLVEEGRPNKQFEIRPSQNPKVPFFMSGIGRSYLFAYIDPNYECKIAYNEGKQIQAKLSGFEDKNWIDVKQPTWEDKYIFRIKPEENKKYWIIAQNSWFENSEAYNRFGPMYHVEEQQDGYSRSNPPLEQDFASYEEAQAWLNKYNSKSARFDRVKKALHQMIEELRSYESVLDQHHYINRDTFEDCFKRLEETICSSPNNQVIFTKEEDE